MEKENFINNVKKWVIIDTQIKHINDKLKQLRDEKYNATQNINNYMSNNTINDKRIEISDGYLKCYEKHDYSPLTFSYIEECLKKIIQNEEQVEYIIKYLKDNREVKSSIDIRRNMYSKKQINE
jgi:uncharacterized protein YllA (UPF0747 family)